jgi:crotonobetaine/carnitine-CoA ligase
VKASGPLPRAPLRGLPLIEQTLPALLERQARAYPDKSLFRCDAVARTYTEVRDAASRSAGALLDAGIVAGDRVAAMCPNRVELLDLILGCAWMGAIAVPINTALRGAQLRHVLSNSGARVLLADRRMLDCLGSIEPPVTLECVWVLDADRAPEMDGYHVELAPAPGREAAIRQAAPGETAAILYTSGTTGVSKGVCCPHAQFYWWGVLVSEMLAIDEDDVLYTCLPLFHTNALNAFVQALVSGATYVLGPRFSASRFWSEVAAGGATVTYLLGAMVDMLFSRPPSEADREHIVRVALAPATPSRLLDPFRGRFGVQLVEGYGSTETNCAIAAPALDHHRPGYMGTVREGFEARVVDEHDGQVPDGAAGELVLRHDHPFSFATGYFGMPDKTVEAWRNLWFHTGDRVVREPDGWVRFIDRAKDAIRRRGENISSFEVEQVLLEHPAVAVAAVFPVPSEMAEDEVMAALVLEPHARLDPVELIRHCEPRLAYFAIPRFVDLVAELPLTENGKVRKHILRERGVSTDTWDREAAGVTVGHDHAPRR